MSETESHHSYEVRKSRGPQIIDATFRRHVFCRDKVGVSMALALKTRRTVSGFDGSSRGPMLWQIGRRTVTLIAIGLFLDKPGMLLTDSKF